MSAGDMDARNAAKVEALRGLGHAEAADDLAALFAGDAKRAQDKEEAQRKAGPPGIPMLSSDAGIDRQAQREARQIAEALRRSGAGQSWRTAGSLLDGGSEGGDRR